MWKQLIRSSLIGGAIVFVWSMISWMVLPFHASTMSSFTDGKKVFETVLDEAPNSGVYVYPGMDDMEKGESMKSFIFVNVDREVSFSSMAGPMVIGIITQFIGAFLITWLLLKTKSAKYWDRVWFVTWVGVVVGFLGMMPFFNWWHFPFGFVFAGFADYAIAWFLAGLAIGRLSQK